MLYSFTVKNFFSFRNLAEVDLTVDGNAPDSTSYFADSKGFRLTKILACFGANASGKTNIVRAVSFMKWWICNSWDQAHDALIPIFPFAFAEKETPIEFRVTFGINDKKYSYELEILENIVYAEKLTLHGVTKPFTVFERKRQKDGSYNLDLNKEWFNPEIQRTLENTARNNSTIIASASRSNHELSLQIVKYFESFCVNVAMQGRILNEEQMGNALFYFLGHPEIKEKTEYYLKKFDTGLTGLAIEDPKTDEEGKRKIAAEGMHGENRLPLMLESSGTRNLATILSLLLQVLRDGGVAVMDELDASIHPLILSEIVSLFISRTSNPLNAQLLFTSHSPSILSDLDKQQVLLLEKDDEGASEAWRLSDVKSKNARTDSNYYAKYMAGAYGGIPRT